MTQTTQTENSYCVDVIGFNPTERLLLSSIFGLAARRDPSFVQRGQTGTRAADLYLVDGSDAAAMAEFRAVRQRYPKPAVLIGEPDPQSGLPALPRPIQWAKLLQSFDEAVQSGGPSKSANPQAADAAVLVVDDNQTVRKFMEAKLQPFGIAADFAETGEQAVGLTGAKEYTCVFLDVVLPGIDGYQVCKLIKSNKQAVKRTAVVMLTSRSSPFDKLRGSLAGCDEYLTKPVDENHLLEVIAKFLPKGARA
jgi:twitching motility two-component system response regulator PilG